MRALQLGTGSFDYGRMHKGGYFFLLFVEYALYFAFQITTGAITSPDDFAGQFVRDPSALYLIGRATTAAIGVTTVYFVYRIGKQLYSHRAGLIAAVFLAFNTLHAVHSHYITVDVPMTFLVTLSIMYMFRIARDGQLKSYVLAGLFAGLATATKGPAITLLVPLSIAHLLHARQSDHFSKRLLLSHPMLAGIAVLVATFLIGNPGTIVNPDKFTATMMAPFQNVQAFTGQLASLDAQGNPIRWRFYLQALWESMGVPLLVFSLIGLGYGCWRRTNEDLICSSFVLAYFTPFLLSHNPGLIFDRYVLPVIPVLAWLTSRLLEDILLSLRQTVRPAVAGAALLLLVASPALTTTMQVYRLAGEDTRSLAKKWFERNVPAGTKVVLEGSRLLPYPTSVPLQNCQENIESHIRLYGATEPGRVRYLKYYLRELSGVTYDLLTMGDHVRPAERWNLPYYKRRGAEYLAVRPQMLRGEGADALGFYEAIQKDPDVMLVRTFKRDGGNLTGPILEIYRIVPIGVIGRGASRRLKLVSRGRLGRSRELF